MSTSNLNLAQKGVFYDSNEAIKNFKTCLLNPNIRRTCFEPFSGSDDINAWSNLFSLKLY